MRQEFGIVSGTAAKSRYAGLTFDFNKIVEKISSTSEECRVAAQNAMLENARV